jgi:putative membrane protein
MKTATVCGGVLGMLLATGLIAYQGLSEVLQSLAVAGWGLALVVLFHLLPLSLDALAWRSLTPHAERPVLATWALARWIRESVNGLLPVGQIGGQFAAVRTLMLYGVSGSTSVASVSVDITLGIATQILFTVSGIGLLLLDSDNPAAKTVLGAVLLGLSLLALGTAGFFLVQRRGLFGVLERLWDATGGRRYPLRVQQSAARIDGAVQALYFDRRALCVSGAWRLASWVAGVGEIWLALWFLGHPVSLAEAWILESLGQALRTSAFVVPGALGVQEGGYILLGGLLGINSPVSLAISLTKRLRELGLGLPGLLAWQLLEGERFWSGRVRASAPVDAEAICSLSLPEHGT